MFMIPGCIATYYQLCRINFHVLILYIELSTIFIHVWVGKMPKGCHDIRYTDQWLHLGMVLFTAVYFDPAFHVQCIFMLQRHSQKGGLMHYVWIGLWMWYRLFMCKILLMFHRDHPSLWPCKWLCKCYVDLSDKMWIN